MKKNEHVAASAAAIGLPERVRDYQERVRAARVSLAACMASGVVPETLESTIDELRSEEGQLLRECLPEYRIRHLDREDIRAQVSPVTASLSGLAELQEKSGAVDGGEENLSEEEIRLCMRLADDSQIPEEPDIPEAENFDESRYECMFWLCARGEKSAFVFGDDGTVLLFEKDAGIWRCRKEPLLTECFAEAAVMESDSSCLIRNVDGGVDRISYERIETPEQMIGEKWYE